MYEPLTETDIDNIPYKALKFRIKNECKDLCNYYFDKKFFFSYKIFTQNENENFVIQFIIHKDKYEFILDKKYPFYPPKIVFNDMPYSQFLKLPSFRYQEMIMKMTNKNCLCCSSFNCKYNWGPAIKLHMIIKEIDKIRNYKRIIAYWILIKSIKQKYCIEVLDIESYIHLINL